MGDVKHTPGPWMNARRSAGAHIHSDTGEVAWLRSYLGIPDEEIEANAHLIAAVPDLLVALSGLLERYVGLVESGDAGFWDAEKEDCVIKARAAIAKATPSLHEGERG